MLIVFVFVNITQREVFHNLFFNMNANRRRIAWVYCLCISRRGGADGGSLRNHWCNFEWGWHTSFNQDLQVFEFRGHLVFGMTVCVSVCQSFAKDFNLANIFWTSNRKGFDISHVQFLWQDLSYQYQMFYLWPWSWPLTYILKTLTSVITFEP